MPVDAPVVPKAETVSNSRKVKGISGSTATITSIDTRMNPRPSTATARARCSTGWEISRPKASACTRPRRDEITAAAITAKVTTLMPPATDPEAPPIYIRPEKTISVTSRTSPKSMMANPAVRPLTEENTTPMPRSVHENGPMVAALPNSTSIRIPMPSSHRNRLVTITSLVSSVKRENRRCCHTSISIIQPSPPSAISSSMAIITMGLAAKRAALPCVASGMMLNPALLNDDTDRNSECHSDLSSPAPSSPRSAEK